MQVVCGDSLCHWASHPFPINTSTAKLVNVLEPCRISLKKYSKHHSHQRNIMTKYVKGQDPRDMQKKWNYNLKPNSYSKQGEKDKFLKLTNNKINLQNCQLISVQVACIEHKGRLQRMLVYRDAGFWMERNWKETKCKRVSDTNLTILSCLGVWQEHWSRETKVTQGWNEITPYLQSGVLNSTAAVFNKRRRHFEC